MPNYKDYSYDQGEFIPVFFDKQILPGTFEYTIHHLIENVLDLSIFEARYKNEDGGAPAYDPKILLKIILFAYSRGIISSRKIAQCCRDNVLFMALSANSRPHFTTISDFVSSLDDEMIHLFRDVLLVCYKQGLVGKEMFAVDGCKLPSNASKAWSGTRKDFRKRVSKLEAAIGRIVAKHQGQDGKQISDDEMSRDEDYIEKLRHQVEKIESFLSDHEDKRGSRGSVKQSNITDNESAKMTTSHGVIQGYTGVAVSDEKHQIVLHAEAFGEGQEHGVLQPMVEGTRENFQAIGQDHNIFKQAKLTADSGFHSEKNLKMLSDEGIDGYIPDKLFRKRDPLFADVDRYRERHKKERAKYKGRSGLFRPHDFTFDKDFKYCICPAGQRLYRNGGNIQKGRSVAVKFSGPKRACVPCELRSKCLRHPDRTLTRQVLYTKGPSPKAPERFMDKMKRKMDSVKGRFIYNKRMGTVEPVFGNIRSCKKLDRFTVRGKRKVNTQWLLFCMVHNLGKVHRYGSGFA